MISHSAGCCGLRLDLRQAEGWRRRDVLILSWSEFETTDYNRTAYDLNHKFVHSLDRLYRV